MTSHYVARRLVEAHGRRAGPMLMPRLDRAIARNQLGRWLWWAHVAARVIKLQEGAR